MSSGGSGRGRWIAVAIVLAALAGLYAWKGVAVRAAERRSAERLAALAASCSEAVAAQNQDLVRLSGLPLAWAVRAELMRGNAGKVDDYLDRFVREPAVARVVFADDAGVITAATDAELEGKRADEVYGGPTLQTEEVRVVAPAGKNLLVVAPVLGLDTRLGTLVVEYSREELERSVPEVPAELPAS